jgi:hypothetical protein
MVTCKSCGARIFWAKTRNCRSMPVDYEPAADGNVCVTLTGGGAQAVVLAKGEEPPEHATRHTSHYATCPGAGEHRKRKPAAELGGEA